MAVKIIIDTSSDLPDEYVDYLDIEMIPVLLSDGENEYRERLDIDLDQVYEDLKAGKFYTTAQTKIDVMMEVFEKYKDNEDGIIYIPLSKGISGTYQTALLAKEQFLEENPSCKLEVFDVKCCAIGYGIVACRAGMLAKDGLSFDEVLEGLEYFSKEQDHLFTVNDMEYLYRGGRVSRTQKVMAGLLSIIPLLDVSKEDGSLRLIDKVRGESKLEKRIFNIMDERSGGTCDRDQTIVVTHGQNEDGANDLIAALKKRGFEDVRMMRVGAVIGAHTGPSMRIVAYSMAFNEKYDKYRHLPEL